MRDVLRVLAFLTTLIVIAFASSATSFAATPPVDVPLQTEFDRASKSVEVTWSDSSLGAPTSVVRYKIGNGDFSGALTAEGEVTINDVRVGQRITIRGKTLGGSGAIEWRGTARVTRPTTCVPSGPLPAQAVMSQDQTSSEHDVFSFSEPVAQNEVLAALAGSGVNPMSLISITNLPDGQVYTAGMVADPVMSIDANFALFNDYLLDDLDSLTTGTFEPSSDYLAPAKQQIDTSGALISAMSIPSSSVASDELISEFSPRLDDVQIAGSSGCVVDDEALDAGSAGGEADAIDPETDAVEFQENTNRTDDPVVTEDLTTGEVVGVEQSASEVTAAAKGIDFTPKRIRVKTFNRISRFVTDTENEDQSYRQNMRKAELSWKWCGGCVDYWDGLSANRRSRSGYEVALRLGTKSGENQVPWGYPVWGFEVPPPASATTVAVGKYRYPKVWASNIPRPYLEDHYGDTLDDVFDITVGSAKAPVASSRRMHWSMTLLTNSGSAPNVRARPVVEAVRYARKDVPLGIRYAGVSLPDWVVDQKSYCKWRKRRPGSCYFFDGGRGEYSGYKRLDNDKRTMVTPGNVVFQRGNLASGGGSEGGPPTVSTDDVDLSGPLVVHGSVDPNNASTQVYAHVEQIGDGGPDLPEFDTDPITVAGSAGLTFVSFGLNNCVFQNSLGFTYQIRASNAYGTAAGETKSVSWPCWIT